MYFPVPSVWWFFFNISKVYILSYVNKTKIFNVPSMVSAWSFTISQHFCTKISYNEVKLYVQNKKKDLSSCYLSPGKECGLLDMNQSFAMTNPLQRWRSWMCWLIWTHPINEIPFVLLITSPATLLRKLLFFSFSSLLKGLRSGMLTVSFHRCCLST